MKNIVICIIALLLVSCSNDIRNIPAGYIGKKLTPSGWDKNILEAGQVDIGTSSWSGSYTSLVILEATSISLKESFGQAKKQGDEDDRIIIGKTPVTVDVYVRMRIPSEKEKRNAIFAQITPVNIRDRESKISVQAIYEQFAKMDIRSGIREVLQKETTVDTITRNLEKFNSMLGAMTIKYFEKSGVPLDVQNVTISNVKVDASVWEAENKLAAAATNVRAIDMEGAALRRNPEYLMKMKWEAVTSGKTVILNEGNVPVVLPIMNILLSIILVIIITMVFINILMNFYIGEKILKDLEVQKKLYEILSKDET